MQIVLWITHRQVSEWALTAKQAARFERRLPSGVRVTCCASSAEFLDALPAADVAVVWKFRQEWFERAPRLRLLSTPAAGREYLAVTPPPGVALHFGAFHGAIMAETVLALILGLCRGVLEHARELSPPRSEAWPRDHYSGRLVRLHGAHLVLLGFGHIGQWIARYAKPFGARITGIRRNPPPERPAFLEASDRVLGLEALDATLPTADHLVLALPATPQTDRILDARRLALLPPTARVYNVGRGNAIDEEALAAALHAGRLAAAALDVCATEPLPAESPLRTAPNCHLYPHVSALAPDYLDLYFEELADRLRPEFTPHPAGASGK